jgi:hypothetical protein
VIELGEDSRRLRLISVLCVIISCLPLLRLLRLDRHDRVCVRSPACRATSHTSQVLDALPRTPHGEYFALAPHLLASRRIEAGPLAAALDDDQERRGGRLLGGKDGMSRVLLSSSAEDPRRYLTVELEEAPSDDRNGT